MKVAEAAVETAKEMQAEATEENVAKAETEAKQQTKRLARKTAAVREAAATAPRQTKLLKIKQILLKRVNLL